MDRFKELYYNGIISSTKLYQAMEDGFITVDDYIKIVGGR